MDTSNEDDYRPPVPPHRNSSPPQPQVPVPPRNTTKVNTNDTYCDNRIALFISKTLTCNFLYRFYQRPSCLLLDEATPGTTIRDTIANMTPNDLRKMVDAQTGKYSTPVVLSPYSLTVVAISYLSMVCSTRDTYVTNFYAIFFNFIAQLRKKNAIKCNKLT